uniref:2-phosphoglycerate kinase n=1 Tax=Chenopodium quinoa TaxID=63459 RepID=A0A803KT53_CHEQI
MKKDKGVAFPAPSSNGSQEPDDNNNDFPDDANPRPFRFAARNASSKYDFVKVKVWLGDNADHYYVLSRFLLSRMLTVTKIPNHVAIKIALELKKLLIDNSLLDVSQNDLEANLFKLMERRGYGEEYINRYKMMTRFHHQRVPLVILVCGTACTGKSTIATQLAQRLNLPNVLQTDMVYELLRTSTEAPLTSTPVWAREIDSSDEFITEFCRECRIVRKGLAGDLKKAMKDGKPIIIEGVHLDPSIYLMDDDNKLSMKTQPKVEETKVASDPSADNPACQLQNQPADNGDIDSGSRSLCAENTSSEEPVSSDQMHEALSSLASVNIEDRASVDKVETLKESKIDENPQTKKERSGAEPIIVPIVLKMAEFDHECGSVYDVAVNSFMKVMISNDLMYACVSSFSLLFRAKIYSSPLKGHSLVLWMVLLLRSLDKSGASDGLLMAKDFIVGCDCFVQGSNCSEYICDNFPPNLGLAAQLSSSVH